MQFVYAIQGHLGSNIPLDAGQYKKQLGSQPRYPQHMAKQKTVQRHVWHSSIRFSRKYAKYPVEEHIRKCTLQ